MSLKAKNRGTSAPDLQHLCRQVADRSPLPMVAVGGTGHTVCYVNPAFCRLIGRDTEELIGIPFAQAVPEGKVCLPLLDRVYRTGEPQNYTEPEHPRSHPPHRSYVMWAIPGTSIHSAGIMVQVTDTTKAAQFRQTAVGMNQELIHSAVRQHELLEEADRLSAGLQLEIGKRMQAEAALQVTIRALEELVQAAPVGITDLDPEGNVISWNPAMEKILGWTEEEFPGKLAPAIEAGQGDAKEVLERLLAGEKLTGVDLRRVRNDGRPVDLLLWTEPLREQNGRLKSTVVILLDVTHLKEMERITLAQQKLSSLGYIAASIAHQIRNPLSGIYLHLQNLEKLLSGAEIPNPEIHEKTIAMITMMKSASAKMDSVVKKVISFSRQGAPSMEPLDVNQCIREAVDMIRVPLQNAGAQVVVSLQEDLPLCRGDMSLIEQALINLMTNAVQAFGHQEGERLIEIRSSLEGSNTGDGYITVAVADSGPGIPEEVRERIFDPFFTTKISGTGFGLSITHKIVSAHGGFIRVGTSRCGGALFTIGLPTSNK